ncbi:hypothetical protein AN218_28600, partial [Streptomyces nanshensis]
AAVREAERAGAGRASGETGDATGTADTTTGDAGGAAASGRPSAETERARLALGQVLHAQTRTADARRRPGRVRELLHEAADLLTADGIDTRLELAAVRYELWRTEGDTAQLRAAAELLRATRGTRRADGTLRKRVEAERRLWLGRVLLALCRTDEGGAAHQRALGADAAAQL